MLKTALVHNVTHAVPWRIYPSSAGYVRPLPACNGMGIERRGNPNKGNPPAWRIQVSGASCFSEIPSRAPMNDSRRIQILASPQDSLLTIIKRMVVGGGNQVDTQPLEVLDRKS